MRYLNDTNIISFALRDAYGIKSILGRHLTCDLLLSAVVVGEGRTGAHRTSRPANWIEGWNLLTTGWLLVPFDALCADHYGRIRADLERRGTMIGHRDCQIAATALAYSQSEGAPVTVVTDNLNLVAGVAPLLVTMDTCCPSWMSQGIIDRNTAIEPWGGVSRPLFSDCGFRPNHQPVVIPDRLIGRFQPTLALRTRMGGARRILARVQPGQHKRSLP